MANVEGGQRTPGRFLREPWCQMLREAAQGLTRDQLAAQAKFSRAKTQSILGGQTRPSMDDLVRLSEALNLSRLRLLAAAGFLDGVDNLLIYLDQLEEQAEGVNHAARQLTSTPISSAARIASAILAEGRYTISVQPVWLGTGKQRLHYSDRIILGRLDGEAISAAERKDIEELLAEELAWSSAGFITWKGEPRELAIHVVRFNAPRHSTGSPTLTLPRSIAVIGGHWAGSADVASLLAYAFDYDFSHVAFTASRAFGRLTHDWENRFLERDQLEVTRTYVEGAGIGRHRVWAADVGNSDETIKILATSRNRPIPFIINLRPGDDLLEWTAHTRSRLRHTHNDPLTELHHLRESRRRADQSMTTFPHSKYLVIDAPLPPPNAVGRDGTVVDDGDAWFDMWSAAAERALDALRTRFAFDKKQALHQLRTRQGPSADDLTLQRVGDGQELNGRDTGPGRLDSRTGGSATAGH
ncbi:helix-turn-helix domain-containing protein [Actinocorallia sp. API 0066]|uniref:helix-turn-helix domain-containing protein n=1 Tax=Actinocorallia sp. API 0066 TaxID=2896846 RepID=UPI001E3C69E5|nr:helix-turn-helix transcriptional regulator [Actinocorallia sp. API 0066]MCD0453091.1 helix-turn-helix domain-containing protein [Actinocorallia sp. API 0066]